MKKCAIIVTKFIVALYFLENDQLWCVVDEKN